MKFFQRHSELLVFQKQRVNRFSPPGLRRHDRPVPLPASFSAGGRLLGGVARRDEIEKPVIAAGEFSQPG